MKVIYIACPYTHPDPRIKEARFRLATVVAAYYVRMGYVVYSPITHTHPIDVEIAGEGALRSDYWATFDETFMAVCTEIVIIKANGWDKSSGIKREIAYFMAHNKPVSYMELEETPAELIQK